MKAHELIANPFRWCTGTHARDSAGQSVAPTDISAVRWNAFGAIEKCYNHPNDRRHWLKTAREYAHDHYPKVGSPLFRLEHSEAVAVLKAIGA